MPSCKSSRTKAKCAERVSDCKWIVGKGCNDINVATPVRQTKRKPSKKSVSKKTATIEIFPVVYDETMKEKKLTKKQMEDFSIWYLDIVGHTRNANYIKVNSIIPSSGKLTIKLEFTPKEGENAVRIISDIFLIDGEEYKKYSVNIGYDDISFTEM